MVCLRFVVPPLGGLVLLPLLLLFSALARVFDLGGAWDFKKEENEKKKKKKKKKNKTA
jgi:hypothetical protein